jgi:hypothetical protein
VNAALDALAEVLALPHPCRCRHCGWRASLPTAAEADAAVDEHVAGCAAHPIRAVERERDELRARVAELEAVVVAMEAVPVLEAMAGAVDRLRAEGG